MKLVRLGLSLLALAGLSIVTLALPAGNQGAVGFISNRLGLGTCLTDHQNSARGKLARYEIAFAEGRIEELDPLSAEAVQALETSLSCSPVSAELWTAVARLHTLRDGLTDQVQADLEMSCRLGPFLYWVAQVRTAAFKPVLRAVSVEAGECLKRDAALLGNFRSAEEI